MSADVLAGHPKEHIQENLKFYRAAVSLGWTDHENLAEVITTQTAQRSQQINSYSALLQYFVTTEFAPGHL